MDCIFCKISVKEVPSYMVYEDAHAFGVLDIAPRAAGHTMIIPKVHAANILELPDVEVGPLFLAVKKVTAKLEKAFHPDAFTIGINHGELSGVPHLHVHVIPRWNDDGGGSLQSIVKSPILDESMGDIAKRVSES